MAFIVVLVNLCCVSVLSARNFGKKSDDVLSSFFDGCFPVRILYALIAVVCSLIILIKNTKKRNSNSVRGNRKRDLER